MRRCGWMAVAVAGLASPALAQDILSFHSPSGNVHCMMFGGGDDWEGARCDILQMATEPTRPADCELDWGHAFEVPTKGAAGPVCAGDTVANPDGFVLAYGAAVSFGGVTCRSTAAAMTCTNADGHGFALSRARQSVF